MLRNRGSRQTGFLATAIGLLIGLGLFACIWYVRSRIFPDFVFMAPRKAAGNYVFSD